MAGWKMRALNIGMVGALIAVGVAGYLSVGDPASAESAPQTATVRRSTVTATVTATGNVESDDSLGLNFSGGGGTLTSLRVKVGDRVRAGQLLATVDDDSQQRSVDSAEASLSSAEAALATAEQRQTSAERERDQASIRSAQVSVDNAEVSLNAAKKTKRLDDRQQAQKVSDAQDALDEAKQQLAADKAALAKAQQAGNQSDISKYQSAVSTDEQTVSQAETSLTTAKQTRDQTALKDQQAIDSAAGQLASAEATLRSQRASAAVNAQAPRSGTVDSAQAQVESAKVSLAGAEADLEKTRLYAPRAGVVSAIASAVGEQTGTTTGGSSSSSSTGAAGGGSSASGSSSSASSSSSSSSSDSGFIILTDTDALQISAKIAEADASKVKTGQQASYTFTALGNGGVTASGTVTSVDVTSSVSNNVVTYGVDLSLAEVPKGLRVGQTAEVSITTGQATNVLAVVNSAITTAGSRKTVKVFKDGKETTVAISTGLTGDATTEVTSGLSDGDAVVLDTPTGGGSGGFPGGLPGGIGGNLGGGLPGGGR